MKCLRGVLHHRLRNDLYTQVYWHFGHLITKQLKIDLHRAVTRQMSVVDSLFDQIQGHLNETQLHEVLRKKQSGP